MLSAFFINFIGVTLSNVADIWKKIQGDIFVITHQRNMSL